VLADASPTGATTKGRLWVGGNLTTNGSYGVNASGTESTSCDDYGLIVGGNIQGDPYVEAGAAAYAGTFTGSQPGPCETRHASPIDFAALKMQIEAYSTALRSVPVTGTISLEQDYLVFTGDSTSLNVFSVDAADFTGNNLRFSVPPNSSILVNVNGAAVTWIGKGFSFPDGSGTCLSGTSTWCHRIVYNFHDATSLQVAGVSVQGTILAPRATFDAGCGNVDGQVFVNQLTGGYEYMPYAFTGCLKPS
jgi:choice-of-anchor A domain-containing protein